MNQVGFTPCICFFRITWSVTSRTTTAWNQPRTVRVILVLCLAARCASHFSLMRARYSERITLSLQVRKTPSMTRICRRNGKETCALWLRMSEYHLGNRSRQRNSNKDMDGNKAKVLGGLGATTRQEKKGGVDKGWRSVLIPHDDQI